MSEEDKVKQMEAGAAVEAPGEQPQEAPEEAGGQPHALQQELEEAVRKADEYRDQMLRLQAELENQRRRAARDVENAHKYGVERLAQELLPVKDSLELGLAAAGGEGQEKLREGMELTLKMLAGALEKFGIQEVNPVGEPFDPQLHQAMSMQESGEQPPNTVLMVMQKGYLLHERLIRPAMVIVSRAPQQGDSLDVQA